jgi:tetratricopeptide (TPR) repeat protein
MAGHGTERKRRFVGKFVVGSRTLGDVRPGTLIGGRFEIEGLARSGGMGSVYRARDQLTGAAVAIKMANADSVELAERFVRETMVLCELRHPAIVRYVAHGQTAAGDTYLAMEWLEGEDLAQRLTRGPLSLQATIALGIRVAQGLSAAHAQGLVHRDIKPSNIFVPRVETSVAGDDVERAKILDFGIVRALHTLHATRAGLVVGTPGYMSPEQARGSPDVDARSDIFALGCVLFECLADRPLFVGRDVVAVQVKIVLEEAPRIRSVRPEIPSSFDRVLARMLAKDPAARPASADEVAAALGSLELRMSRSTTLDASRPTTGVQSSQQLTAGEQRLLCVVIARLLPRKEAPVSADGATLAVDDVGARLLALRDIANTFGGRLEPIADGSLVVPLEGTGAATDQASRAARCALRMHAIVPEAAMALATGRADASARLPVGEVIDRASRLLAASETDAERGIHIDELTAGLLDTRFEIEASKLRGFREMLDARRTLLGKPTPCVGRTRELGTLEAIFDQCVTEGVAQAVLIEGAGGLGKSRLREEFLAKLQARGEPIEIWIGRGDPMSVGAPFAMLSQAVRRGLGILDGEALAVRRLKLRTRLARYYSSGRELERVAAFLGELISVPIPEEGNPQLQAARHDPILMGDQMRRAFEDLIAREAGARPVVLVLEDLQWGDLPTVQFLDAALRNLPDLPFMVVALARPEVDQMFPSLWAGRVLTRLQLAELPKKAAIALCKSVLGDGVRDEVITRLVERAAGNAFFLEELIRATSEGREELPDTVLAMVQTRLAGLPKEARRVLRAASVFGQVFWESAVAALIGGETSAAPAEWLPHLVGLELIVRREDASFAGEREYIFRHALLHQAAYAMLLDDDRVLGHRLAGEWLEQKGDTNAVALAEHFERGHAPDRARVWYHAGAHQALEGNEYRAVLARAERAIACGASGESLGALRLLQAEAHRWMADYAQTESYGLEAMENLPRGGAAWLNAAGDVAIASSLRGNVDRLVLVSEDLTQLPADVDHELLGLHVVAWARATVWLLRHGKQELAAALFLLIEDAIRLVGERDPAVMARVHYARANRAFYGGDLGEYLRFGEAAAASFEQAGMLRNLCVQRKSIASAQLQLGLHREAEECLRVALVEAERLALYDNVADARDLLGLALARQGQLDEAISLVERGVGECAAHGSKWAEGRARATLASVLMLRGDLPRAEDEARAALAGLIKMAPLRAVALATLGRIRLQRGDPNGAHEATRSAMSGLSALSGDQESLVRLAHLEALIATNDPEARAMAAASRAAVLARAEKIADAAHREGFLTRVPENARLLELGAQLN